jgi:predicted RNase H-like HicB family nuclease
MNAIEDLTHSQNIVFVTWKQYDEAPPHEFEAIACPEDEGGFSIFAPYYPGVISQGDTIEEAKLNVAEAFVALLESKQAHGEKIFSFDPWMEPSPNSMRVWVTVDG